MKDKPVKKRKKKKVKKVLSKEEQIELKKRKKLSLLGVESFLRRKRRSEKCLEFRERIKAKLKLKEERLNCEDEKERKKWENFYRTCEESVWLDQLLKELKAEGVVKETGKPQRVEFFLKDGSKIRTIHFMGELFYTKMGMLYNFNINKKDYFAVREYGMLPTWFKCRSTHCKDKWVNVWSEKQIRYLLEIMDDMKLLVGCKPHHFVEHYFDRWTDKYLEDMQKNWKKMAMGYAVKFNVARWEKKEFKMLSDADIITDF